MNLAKSKFVPASLTPKSQTRNYQVTGQQEKGHHTGIGPDGKPTLIDFTVNYDGKDYPYKGSPDYDVISIKQTDANTSAFIQKLAGKVVFTGTRTVSKDGKTLTIIAKGTTVKGEATNSVQVFDRR